MRYEVWTYKSKLGQPVLNKRLVEYKGLKQGKLRTPYLVFINMRSNKRGNRNSLAEKCLINNGIYIYTRVVNAMGVLLKALYCSVLYCSVMERP